MANIIGTTNVREVFYQSELAQGIANIYPEYFYARSNRYSVIQTMVSPIAEEFELAFKSVQDAANVFNPLTTYNNYPLQVYKVNLPDSWEFDYISKADDTSVFVPPNMFGTIDSTDITISIAAENSIFNYKNNVPTRCSIEFDTRLLNQGLVASSSFTKEQTIVDAYLKADTNLFLNIPNQLYTDVAYEGVPQIIISGTNYANGEVSENIAVTGNGTFQTANKYTYIDKIWTIGFSAPVDIDIYDYPNYIESNLVHETYWKFYDRTSQESNIDLKYRINSTTASDLLQYFFYDIDDDERFTLEIQTSKLVMDNFELRDTNNTRITSIDSILPSIYNTDIYALSNNKLYIFDKRNEVSQLAKDLRGYDHSPDSYLIADLRYKERSQYYTGNGVTTDLTTSVRFTDNTQTWVNNELSGKSLLLGGIEYLIISNTLDTLTVSSKTSDFEYINDIAAVSTAYQILGMPLHLTPIRVKGTDEARRIRITYKHESGIEFYFDGSVFNDAGSLWIPNPIDDGRIELNYGTIKSTLPFTGSYQITFEVEYERGNVLDIELFKSVITLGEKKAKAQFNLAEVGAGISTTAMYFDYGDLVLIMEQDLSISGMTKNGGTTAAVPASDTYTGVLLSEFGSGITPGSVTVTDGVSSWTDDSLGGLTASGAPAVDGTIDYDSGVFVLNWTSGNQPASTDIGVDYTYHEIAEQVCIFHKDYATVDFVDKTIYCFERYDDVDVSSTTFTETGITVENTTMPEEVIEDYEGTW